MSSRRQMLLVKQETCPDCTGRGWRIEAGCVGPKKVTCKRCKGYGQVIVHNPETMEVESEPRKTKVKAPKQGRARLVWSCKFCGVSSRANCRRDIEESEYKLRLRYAHAEQSYRCQKQYGITGITARKVPLRELEEQELQLTA